jgi:hypothetical protein
MYFALCFYHTHPPPARIGTVDIDVVCCVSIEKRDGRAHQSRALLMMTDSSHVLCTSNLERGHPDDDHYYGLLLLLPTLPNLLNLFIKKTVVLVLSHMYEDGFLLWMHIGRC